MEWNTNDELLDQAVLHTLVDEAGNTDENAANDYECDGDALESDAPERTMTFQILHNTAPVGKAVRLCIKLHQRALRRKIRRRFLKELIEDINAYVYGVLPPLPSNYKAKAAMLERYPVKSAEYDICPNGCMIFTNARNDVDEACISEHHASRAKQRHPSNLEKKTDVFDGETYNISEAAWTNGSRSMTIVHFVIFDFPPENSPREQE
ncbi:uncharacterized protein BYT42DRAFT_616706 [Radiomyces spectabilis]|uniref:uncharacterized protein n=1 Tax=Radiomyces spectabilis TaxID=64574 RepID=UPI002220FD48|nr:uncharacterized protein BYT42DRAFT_616706 [Radiomyces spectabilis]KAI8371629.1 hypothetical protein BYT42DRAFT_616706 [Radiomyces spectabilis]